MSSITLADAEKMMAAGKKYAEETRVSVAISVVDARGDLIAMSRMDGAPFFTSHVSHAKAMASAAFNAPSRELTHLESNPVLQSLKFLFRPGAVPIVRSGALEGAVGVGGGTADQDEAIARAGIDAVVDN